MTVQVLSIKNWQNVTYTSTLMVLFEMLLMNVEPMKQCQQIWTEKIKTTYIIYLYN